jgi:uncharacterized protein with HEPN domain
MLEAGKSAVDFVAGRDRAALDRGRMLLFALVRAIEIIGEAATKVSVETGENTRRCHGAGSSACEIG